MPVARSLRSLCGPDLHCSILEGGAELSWRLSGSQGAGAAPGAQGGGEAPLHGIPAGWCVPGPGLTAVVSVSLQPHDGPAGKALFLTPVRKRSAGAEPLTALSASCQLTCARRGFQRDPVALSRALAAPGWGSPERTYLCLEGEKAGAGLTSGGLCGHQAPCPAGHVTLGSPSLCSEPWFATVPGRVGSQPPAPQGAERRRGQALPAAL